MFDPARRHGAGRHAPSEEDTESRLDVVPAEVAPGAARANDYGPWLTAAAAGAAHFGILLALWFNLWAVEPAGGGGQYLDAISVELVPSQVLESQVPQQAATQNGGSTADIAPAKAEDKPKPKAPTDETKPRSDQEPPPQQEPQPQVEQSDTPPQPEPPKPPPKQTETAKVPSGATSRAAVESAGAAAAASASAGAVSRYAVRVRVALAQNKPRELRRQGTVTITFALDAIGKLRFARVTASSGHGPLDEAVLAAVRNTAFPAPPADMTAQQLTYIVPFHFE